MNCCNQILATNAGGVPYIVSTNTTVGTESVDIALGFRVIKPVGYLTVIINDVITSDVTTTLPINLSMNGIVRALTLPNGTQVTVADLVNVGVITMFNDRSRNLLVLMSRTIS